MSPRRLCRESSPLRQAALEGVQPFPHKRYGVPDLADGHVVPRRQFAKRPLVGLMLKRRGPSRTQAGAEFPDMAREFHGLRDICGIECARVSRKGVPPLCTAPIRRFKR